LEPHLENQARDPDPQAQNSVQGVKARYFTELVSPSFETEVLSSLIIRVNQR
jgi:hypothetical protein